MVFGALKSCLQKELLSQFCPSLQRRQQAPKTLIWPPHHSRQDCQLSLWTLALGRAESTWAHVAELSLDVESTFPPGPTELIYSREMHAEGKKATTQQDEVPRSLGKHYGEGGTHSCYRTICIFPYSLFTIPRTSPYKTLLIPGCLHIPTFPQVVGRLIPRWFQLLLSLLSLFLVGKMRQNRWLHCTLQNFPFHQMYLKCFFSFQLKK